MVKKDQVCYISYLLEAWMVLLSFSSVELLSVARLKRVSMPIFYFSLYLYLFF